MVSFAKERGWSVKDGRIFFPDSVDGGSEDGGPTNKEMSQMVIENALGYARELETIV